MATLNPANFLDDKSLPKGLKNCIRRQSECMPQAVSKELNEENFDEVADLLKQQETLRIRPTLSDYKPR